MFQQKLCLDIQFVPEILYWTMSHDCPRLWPDNMDLPDVWESQEFSKTITWNTAVDCLAIFLSANKFTTITADSHKQYHLSSKLLHNILKKQKFMVFEYLDYLLNSLKQLNTPHRSVMLCKKSNGSEYIKNHVWWEVNMFPCTSASRALHFYTI